MHLVTGNPNSEFSREVEARFAANGVQWTTGKTPITAWCWSPERFQQRNLSLNSEARVAEFELTMSAHFSVLDADNQEVMQPPRSRSSSRWKTIRAMWWARPRKYACSSPRCARDLARADHAPHRLLRSASNRARMRLYPEKLAGHLQQQLLPVYLVSGDEPLLLQECSDQIRQKAREQGCSEREVIDAGVSGFNWQDILHSATSMSLFAERKLVELRLPSGKPGAEGSKALCEYLDIASGDDVLLIIAGKIDKQSTNSKWYKALDKAGATIQVWPVDAKTCRAGCNSACAMPA